MRELDLGALVLDRDALQPTVVALQQSAFELLDRMIAVGQSEEIIAG
jgi:hypothetical protein